MATSGTKVAQDNLALDLQNSSSLQSPKFGRTGELIRNLLYYPGCCPNTTFCIHRDKALYYVPWCQSGSFFGSDGDEEVKKAISRTQRSPVKPVRYKFSNIKSILPENSELALHGRSRERQDRL